MNFTTLVTSFLVNLELLSYKILLNSQNSLLFNDRNSLIVLMKNFYFVFSAHSINMSQGEI